MFRGHPFLSSLLTQTAGLQKLPPNWNVAVKRIMVWFVGLLLRSMGEKINKNCETDSGDRGRASPRLAGDGEGSRRGGGQNAKQLGLHRWIRCFSGALRGSRTEASLAAVFKTWSQTRSPVDNKSRIFT